MVDTRELETFKERIKRLEEEIQGLKNNPFIEKNDAAKKYNISFRRLSYYIQKGELKKFKWGKKVFMDESQIIEKIRSGEVEIDKKAA